MTEIKSAFTPGNVRLGILLLFLLSVLVILREPIIAAMSKGCFNLSLEVADSGITMSDQSYCSKEDMENLAGELVETGAESVRNQADSLAMVYNNRLEEMAKANEELSSKLNDEMRGKESLVERKRRFNEFMARQLGNPNSAQVARKINDAFQELFAIIPSEPIAYEEVKTTTPEEVRVMNAQIQQDFDVRTRSKVERINQSIRIKK